MTDPTRVLERRFPSIGSLFALGMRVLFYGLFLASLMSSTSDALPVSFTVPIGTSRVSGIDLLLLAFGGTWIVSVGFSRFLRFPRAHALVYALVLVLILPAATGLASGKSLLVVLRDCRTPLFFLGILPMLAVIRTYGSLLRLMRFMAVVGTGSLLAGFALWLLVTPPPDTNLYRFGMASALGVIVWLLFLSIGVVSLERSATRLRRWAWTYILLALVFVFLANDIRSVYIGVIGALLVMGIGYISARELRVRRRIRRLAVGMVLLTTLLGTLFLSPGYWGPGVQAVVLDDMRLRRLYSLIDPTLGGTLEVGPGGSNRDDRLLGLSYGLELARRNVGFGLGYGDNAFVDLDPVLISILVQRNRLEGNPGNAVENLLFAHNSYGWALGRLGLWGAGAYFLIIALLCHRAWRATMRTESRPLRIILLGTLTFLVHMLLVGFGGGAFFDYTGQGLVTWLVCLTVLVRATMLAEAAAGPVADHRRWAQSTSSEPLQAAG